MLLRPGLFLRHLYRTEVHVFRQSSAAAGVRKQDIFYDTEVQSILKSLTGRNHDKVFRVRRVGRPATERSVFQFLTDEELKELQQEADQKAEKKLQMPPVMNEREETGMVLEEDPLLVGLDVSKFVFTDITYGVSDRERLVVVRETDGTLRTANWDERDRMDQIYYPREGRKHYLLPMFEPENLAELLKDETKYEYILDRNCLQFEPDHPLYIRTAETVYNHINEKKTFNVLHSTRHYGPMVFYLCWCKQIDDFIVHKILNQNLAGAAEAVKLFSLIHKDTSLEMGQDDRTTVRNFASSPAARRGDKIKMALEKLA